MAKFFLPKNIRAHFLTILILPLVAGLCFPDVTRAQSDYWEASAKIFNSNSVAIIKVEIDPNFLAYILDPANAESDSLFPARMIFENADIAADTLENVGFRLRGNTSRYAQKKSFKLDLNEFVRGQDFYGLEKMNLNGEHNDPAILRSLLAWSLFNDYGVPASRATHAALHVNGAYYGLYALVEHYDEEFMQARFGNNDGNLYKCLYPADLAWLGPDQAPYKRMRNSRQRVYELHINEEQDDYSDLVRFIDFLNNTSDADFARGLEERFNVRAFLKYLAVNTLIGSWDDYWFLKNNYYLYHNTATDKFEFIPYDYDNTYGVDFVGGDWGTRDIYDFGNASEPRPLVTRILAIPGYRNLYSAHLKEVMNGIFTLAGQEPKMNRWRMLAEPWVQNDTYYPRDYGFTFADWQQALDAAWGRHVEYGIRPYIQTRLATAAQQLEEGPLPAEISEVQFTPSLPAITEDVLVTCRVKDPAGVQTVDLLYSVSGGPPVLAAMYDDGMHGDGEANDGLWAGKIFGQRPGRYREFFVRARGGAGAWTIYPESAPFRKILIPNRGRDFPLVINEFMASNDTTITDEFGENDDWVEIYNTADTSVSLAGVFLTDNLNNPTKWQFPDTTLASKSFLLVWADDTPLQGALHAPYKLAAEGEQLGIFAPLAFGNFLIDTLSFGAQATDISYGRVTDGGATWTAFTQPTPGRSNVPVTGVAESQVGQFALPRSFQIEELWPNPAKDVVTVRLAVIQMGVYEIGLFDVLGREVVRKRQALSEIGRHDFSLALTSLISGVYFVRVEAGGRVERAKLVLVR